MSNLTGLWNNIDFLDFPNKHGGELGKAPLVDILVFVLILGEGWQQGPLWGGGGAGGLMTV